MVSFTIALRRMLPFATLLALACTPPDVAERIPDPLPDDLLTWLHPDTVRAVAVGDGVWYHYLWSPEGPWAIHLAEADLRRCGLALEVQPARVPPGAKGGFETVTEMVARRDETTVVAVNGDFFTPEGRPVGPEVSHEGVRSTRSRPGVVYLRGTDPWIGTVEVEDGALSGLGWPVGEGDDAARILGGFPELLDEGVRLEGLRTAGSPSFAAQRHPRTAVGLDSARDRLWIAVVDGRAGDHSTGMTLEELASLFEGLGATEALNLDGGGSSVMVVRGKTTSRPSDETGERPVVNALILKDDPALCFNRPEPTGPR